ncbi:hypothetical protein N7456_006541 [Penicillium angulare]|uniref:Uncharacterized protein n=1 Tax=Penicillium angulare TaxID=116970 RepID=A0A9W9FHZ8_9EURO|nr:hypothetical protein N7456_006541 [Penicillium angulare]
MTSPEVINSLPPIPPMWRFDESTNTHIFKESKWFKGTYTPFKSFVVYKNEGATPTSLPVLGFGDAIIPVEISGPNSGQSKRGIILLKKALYCPQLGYNLIGSPYLQDWHSRPGNLTSNDIRAASKQRVEIANQLLGFVSPRDPYSGEAAMNNAPRTWATCHNVQFPHAEEQKMNKIPIVVSSESRRLAALSSAEREWLEKFGWGFVNEEDRSKWLEKIFLEKYGLDFGNEEDRKNGRALLRALMK